MKTFDTFLIEVNTKESELCRLVDVPLFGETGFDYDKKGRDEAEDQEKFE